MGEGRCEGKYISKIIQYVMDPLSVVVLQFSIWVCSEAENPNFFQTHPFLVQIII